MRGQSPRNSAQGRSLILRTAHTMHTRSPGWLKTPRDANILFLLEKRLRLGWLRDAPGCMTGGSRWIMLKSLVLFLGEPVVSHPEPAVSHPSDTADPLGTSTFAPVEMPGWARSGR